MPFEDGDHTCSLLFKDTTDVDQVTFPTVHTQVCLSSTVGGEGLHQLTSVTIGSPQSEDGNSSRLGLLLAEEVADRLKYIHRAY